MTKQSPNRFIALALLYLSALNLLPSTLFAQVTAFTYQGRLFDGAAPANGTYTVSFAVWSAASGGTQLAGPLTLSGVAVSNGLFTVNLDFGGGVFTGNPGWMQINVATNGGGLSGLSPRQQLTPTPYAQFAATASNLSGSLPAGQINGTLPSAALAGTYSNTINLSSSANSFSGNGTGLSNVNASLLGGLSASQFWNLTGNGGTTAGVNFLGTTDNQPLELKANLQRALRLEPNLPTGAPNLIGGCYLNLVQPGTVGAAIGGGGATSYQLNEPAIGGNYNVVRNQVASDFGVIGGGGINLIESNSPLATISGGAWNTIETNSRNSTIVGGLLNIELSAPFSVLGGGVENLVTGTGSFLGGGGYDGGNLGVSGNLINANASALVGGVGNQIIANSDYSFLGGGIGNSIGIIDGIYSSAASCATIAGGQHNTNAGFCASIPGGFANAAEGSYSLAAGQNAKALHDGAFVWADHSSTAPFSSTGDNQFLIRASGGVGIGTENPASLLDVNGQVTIEGHDTSALLFYDPGIYDMRWYGEKTSGGHTMTLLDNSTGNRFNLLTIDNSGNATFAGSATACSITINGGCDLAEPFDLGSAPLAQGSLVVIDDKSPGQLKQSVRAYDSRVAGIVSGANGVNPGISLQQPGVNEGGQNVALSGRVYALADASYGPIAPGDLLTTSDTPGHCMKATDRLKAQGAVIGKAMSSLGEGKGMVLVLVSLQ